MLDNTLPTIKYKLDIKISTYLYKGITKTQ